MGLHSLKIESLLRVDASALENIISLSDKFMLEGWMAPIFAEKSECPNEFAFEILGVATQLFPDPWSDRDRPPKQVFVVGRYSELRDGSGGFSHAVL